MELETSPFVIDFAKTSHNSIVQRFVKFSRMMNDLVALGMQLSMLCWS